MLTAYQRGSIFGAVIVAVAFAASFFTIPYSQRPPSKDHAADIESSQHQQESLWGATTSDPIAIFTAALVFVGGVQALLFLWQLDLIRKGLVNAKESADTAADAAGAAVRQATAAEETLTKRERPWLFVFGVQYPRKADVPLNPWYVEFSVGNYGLMPCVIDSAAFDVMISSNKNDIPVPGDIHAGHNLISNGVVGANEKRDKLSCIIHDSLALYDNGVLVIFGEETIPVPQFTINSNERAIFRIIVKGDYPSLDINGACRYAVWLCRQPFQWLACWRGRGSRYARIVRLFGVIIFLAAPWDELTRRIIVNPASFGFVPVAKGAVIFVSWRSSAAAVGLFESSQYRLHLEELVTSRNNRCCCLC